MSKEGCQICAIIAWAFTMTALRKGFKESFKESFRESREDTLLSFIKSLVKNLHMTAEQAMIALGIPAEEHEKYIKRLAIEEEQNDIK